MILYDVCLGPRGRFFAMATFSVGKCHLFQWEGSILPPAAPRGRRGLRDFGYLGTSGAAGREDVFVQYHGTRVVLC